MGTTNGAPASRTPGARAAGLDAVRGFAVAAVVAFHLWPDAVPAGFLGVSLFFTLSGFVIMLSLDAERTSTGTISLGAFWGRRARRLWPGSLAVLGAVSVLWLAAGWMTDTISRGIATALFNVANWHEILAHRAYGVDVASSPVLHFWSLAIEEQIYVVLPIVVLLCATRRGLLVALTGMLAVAAAATVHWRGDATVVYYSTFTRSGEVALGALAALLLGARPARRARTAIAARGVAVGGICLLTLLMLRTSLATGAYYEGGLLAVGVLSVVVIGAVSRSGAAALRADRSWLGHLGRISYGIYLIHWPLLLASSRLGLDGWRLAIVTITGTVVLAEVSYRVLEQPVRVAPTSQRRRLQGAAGLAAGLVLVTALLPGHVAADSSRLEAGRREFDDRFNRPAPTPAPTIEVPSGPIGEPASTPTSSLPSSSGPPIRVGMFGDSKVISFGLGMVPTGDPRIAMVGGSSEFGCPLGRSDRLRRSPDALPEDVADACDWSTTWPAALDRTGPLDVAIVYFGTWDVTDQQVAALSDDFVHIGTADFDAWLLGEMTAATELLAPHARTVVWLTVSPDPNGAPAERYARYNDLVRELAARSDGSVEVLDLGGWLESTGELDRLLPDGVHATWEGGGTAEEIGERYLIPVLQQLFDAPTPTTSGGVEAGAP